MYIPQSYSGTAPFWHWRGMAVFQEPGAYHYFSAMAGLNLFASLWLLMEGFCQLREWSLRHCPWVRRISAWPVSVLLYAVIVPIVSIFVCFGMIVLKRALNGVFPETDGVAGGWLGKAAVVFARFLSWLLTGVAPPGWLTRVLLLMVLPSLLLWEFLACVSVLLSRPEPEAPHRVLEDDGEADAGESPKPLEDMQ